MNETDTPTIVLKRGRESSLLRHHPWVFSGAIRHEPPGLSPGATVSVLSEDGRVLGTGAYSPVSQIRTRMWSFAEDAAVDEAFLGERLRDAIALRAALPGLEHATGQRLVNAEADGLPGLIVDRYAGWLVCQFLSAGTDRWREALVDLLAESVPCEGIYERSDADVRGKEGLPSRVGRLHGSEPPDLVEIRERNCRYLVDIRNGHKTGFYLDQRNNRHALQPYSVDRTVLNCFCYTGGFGVSALKHGAQHVVNVDVAESALALAARNASLNGLDEERFECVRADVFTFLRSCRDARKSFDVIVLDPPRFAAAKSHVQRASRGYKDINLLAFKLLRPGGKLLTFSCSGSISAPLFQKIVADAALDAGRPARALQFLDQAPDHPVLLSFPEGRYLKGLVCQV